MSKECHAIWKVLPILVLSPILGAVIWCNFITSNIFIFLNNFLKRLFGLVFIYYSILSSIYLYSQVPDIINLLQNYYKTFLIKFKIALNSLFFLLIALTFGTDKVYYIHLLLKCTVAKQCNY